ncbi:hypothetical protein OSTOST_20594 [Ostertagia ostertagi]
MRWNETITKAIASLVCVILWCLSLQFISRHIPSISGEEKYFPKQLINDDNALNRYRLNISEQLYRNSIKESDHFSPLEIRILVSDRRQDYLLQVIAFLIDSYQSHRRLSPSLELCNVEPVVFEELRRFQLHIPIRIISKTGSRQLPLNDVYKQKAFPTTGNASIEQQKRVYTHHFVFDRYVMLLEDDALVVPEFARMMTSLMKQLDRRPYVDYVKLYHPNQLRKIPSIPMAIALSLNICYLYQVIVFRRVFLLWLVATSALMYAFLRSYGSQLLADVRYAITKSVYMTVTESCCTPAVVFRARKIPAIVSKLLAVSNKRAFIGHAKDHISTNRSLSEGKRIQILWSTLGQSARYVSVSSPSMKCSPREIATTKAQSAIISL